MANSFLDLIKNRDNAELAEEQNRTLGTNIEPISIPMAPSSPDMPDFSALAQEEAMSQPQEPVRAPALGSNSEQQISRSPAADISSSIMNKTKTVTSGSAPSPEESPEARLERLMGELQTARRNEMDDAASRKMKADMLKGVVDNVGLMVGGAQSMNTGANVTPAKVQGYDVGDLVGQVDKKFAGDRQALMEQYKQLLNARDRKDNQDFRQESLKVQREGNRIKNKLAEQKANKIDNILTDGEKKSDETFAKDFNNLTSKGFNNAETAISRIEKVAEELEKEGDGAFSAGGGRTSILSDSFRSRDSIRWRDAAQNEANATLKELFPGSLSDDERRAAAKEFYNDQLSNSENAKILKAKAAQLKQNVADQRKKAEIFSRYGTLAPRVTGNEIISAPIGQQNTISNSKTVERLDKATGKIAIFDAQTKQFLKYKD